MWCQLKSILRKNVPSEWSLERDLAFVKSKNALSEKALLVLFDTLKPVSLTVDANISGVPYTNKLQSKVFQYFGVQKFHKYLFGRKCSNQEPLKFLFSEKNKVPMLAYSRLVSWSIILSTYNYQIIFRKESKIPQLVDIPECNFIYNTRHSVLGDPAA